MDEKVEAYGFMQKHRQCANLRKTDVLRKKEPSPVRETALLHNMAIIYSAVWSAPCRKLSNSVPNRSTLSSISFSMPFQKNCITKPIKA